MNSQTLISISIVTAIIVIAVVVITMAIRRMRREQLRQKFGPEYDYIVAKEGDALKAEQTLAEREKKVSALNLHSLAETMRSRYSSEWIQVQADFVDNPRKSVDDASRLITEVMIARGFPVEDFDQRAADLSVLFPELVPNYRQANEIAQRNQDESTSTEDLRQAMIYYHSLFEKLLETENPREMETVR